MKKLIFIWVLLIVFSIVGEVKCAIHALQCDWNPIGKAEIIYTASFITGFGAIVGWFDIKDSQNKTSPIPPAKKTSYNKMLLPKPVYIPEPKNYAVRRV